MGMISSAIEDLQTLAEYFRTSENTIVNLVPSGLTLALRERNIKNIRSIPRVARYLLMPT